MIQGRFLTNKKILEEATNISNAIHSVKEQNEALISQLLDDLLSVENHHPDIHKGNASRLKHQSQYNDPIKANETTDIFREFELALRKS